MFISQLAFSEINFIDQIAVIVDDGQIMESEVNEALKRAISNLEQNNAQIPPKEFLFQRVLEGMIIDEILVQKGEKFGVRISDQELNDTLDDIAKTEGLTIKEFKEELEKDGGSFKLFRESIKNELIKRRVQSGLVRPKIVISEQEIQNYINSTEGENLISTEYKIDQILIKVPLNPDEEIFKNYEEKALEIIEELNAGLKFEEAINNYSFLKDEEDFGGIYWKKK